jgi:Zn-dependent peptidase ImmA (M78 family)
MFAAELLMPAELVREAALQRYGSPIDGTVPREQLAHLLGNGIGENIDSLYLAQMPQEKRAALFAVATSFGFGTFEPLTAQFGVSRQAMAIRLVELDLVI